MAPPRSLSTLLPLLALAGPDAHADTPKPRPAVTAVKVKTTALPKVTIAAGKEPKLAPQVRAKLIKDAIVQSGQRAPADVPSPTVSITPIAPVRDGAQIAMVTVGAFLGPVPNRPNGAFNVRSTSDGGYIELRFPAQPGKLHVLDCAVEGRELEVTGHGNDAVLRPSSGHIMHVHTATTRSLQFYLKSPHPWSFYGCELTVPGT